MPRYLPLILIFFSFSYGSYAQQDGEAIASKEYLACISHKASHLSSTLDKNTQKVLKAFQKREAVLYRKLYRKDSIAAMRLKQASKGQYANLQASLEGKVIPSFYHAYLDTLKTSIRFLEQNKTSLSIEKYQALEEASSKLKGLDKSLASGETVKAFLKERRRQLRDAAANLYPKDLKKLDKQAYYYAARVVQYKELLKDRKKAERKALEMLTATKAYQEFFRKNSQLASLFRLPGSSGLSSGGAAAVSLQGLQTRASVSQAITQRFGSGADVMQQLRENVQEAQGQLNSLKQKAASLGSGSYGNGDAELPEGFIPNEQKTKTFGQRLEWGSNLQFAKSNVFFPTIANIGFSIGYKINAKSIVGLGASYRLGIGSIHHVRLSNQGIGVRSFMDWKLEKQFFISGAYELTHNQAFENTNQLNNFTAWHHSPLLGLSKILNLKTNFFKQTKLQVLYDFLYKSYLPVSQPFVFRLGYNF